MGVVDLRYLRQLEDEKPRLKKQVADLNLDKGAAGGIEVNTLRLAKKRLAVRFLLETYLVSVRRGQVADVESHCLSLAERRDDRAITRALRKLRKHEYATAVRAISVGNQKDLLSGKA